MTDMYIASCDKNGGIYHYVLDGEQVTEKQFVPIDRPMYMEISGDTLYAVLRDPEDKNESAVVSFDIDVNGNLTNQKKTADTLGKVGCHLAVSEEGIFVANYVSGSVFRTPNMLVCHEGSGVHPARQEAPHPHCTVITPDKKYVCVADLGVDKIFVYDLNLKLKNTVSFPAGAGPRYIAFSDDGKLMYCVSELSNEVFSYTYCDGKFEFIQKISTLPEGFDSQNIAAAIRIKDGFLYASNRGHNSIAVYKTDGEKTERLTIVECGGKGPRDFNISGDMLICTNENSGDVTFFKLKAGIPEMLDIKLSMLAPLNVIFKD